MTKPIGFVYYIFLRSQDGFARNKLFYNTLVKIIILQIFGCFRKHVHHLIGFLQQSAFGLMAGSYQQIIDAKRLCNFPAQGKSDVSGKNR